MQARSVTSASTRRPRASAARCARDDRRRAPGRARPARRGRPRRRFGGAGCSRRPCWRRPVSGRRSRERRRMPRRCRPPGRGCSSWRMRAASIRQALAAGAADAEPAVRAEAAAVLGLLANPGAAPLVARLARDRYAGVRAAAAAAAGRLVGTLPAGAHEREALGGELRRLLQDPAPDVRSAAAWGAGMARCPECDLWLLQRLGRERDAGGARPRSCRSSGAFPARCGSSGPPGRWRTATAGVRFAAAWSLARSGRAEAVAGLRRACRRCRPAGAHGGAGGRPARRARGALARAARRRRRCRRRGSAWRRWRDWRPRSTAIRRAHCRRDAAAAVKGALADADPLRVQERVVAVRLAGAARCCSEQLEGDGGRGGALGRRRGAGGARADRRRAG